MAEAGESSVSRATSPDEGQSAFHAGSARRVYVVALRAGQLDLPPLCACCASPPSTSRVLRRADSEPLVVPYCATCDLRWGRLRTRTLSFSVAACLMALTLTGVLPVLFERMSFAAYALVVVLGSLGPALLAFVLALRRLPTEHPPAACRAEGAAVRFISKLELACRNPDFAAALAARHGSVPTLERAPLDLPSPWLGAGALLAFAMAWLLHPLHYPSLRVVNLSATEQPTSAESSRAGLETRVAAGPRTLEARDAQGSVLERLEVRFEAGRTHLFAPRSEGYCFWLESTNYGRAPAPDKPLLALDPAPHFWVLELPIDSWFSPNPSAAAGDDRSTGGVLTALRQARCSELPPKLLPGAPASDPTRE